MCILFSYIILLLEGGIYIILFAWSRLTAVEFMGVYSVCTTYY